VSNSASLTPALWGFGFALLALGAFSVQLMLGWRGGVRASTLVAVMALSALCALAGLSFALSRSETAWALWRAMDIARAAGWAFFVLLLFRSAGECQDRHLSRASQLTAIGGMGALMVTALLAIESSGGSIGIGHRWSFAVSLGLAVFGLVCVEQLLRTTAPNLRWGVKPLCIGLGGLFAFDLFMYTDGVLFGQLDAETWTAHGAIQALVIPFIAVSTARNKDWTVDVAVSRRVVFRSTALLACGLYLLGVAAMGYYIRYFGGSWGAAIQLTLLFAASVLLGVLITSGTLRSKLRVLVNKHFFSYRYDYREEWLRFTNLLAHHDAESSIYQRVVQALADLVESPGGAVWVRRGATFRQVARWNAPEIRACEPVDGSLAEFVVRTGWVIDLSQQQRTLTQIPDWLLGWRDAWLVIPLISRETLLGIVILTDPRVKVDLNWEVLDLLKTAGRQAASYLGQIEAREALLEAEKFAAFNRMSAFVVHDLKNLVAQLSLMLKNAERHHDNPEFQRDMLDTVRHVGDRMNRLLAQLRLGAHPVENAKHVNLSAIVDRVGRTKASQRMGLAVEGQENVYTVGHEDRLEHVLGHLVQNAIDATTAHGKILIRVSQSNQSAIVEIIDDGIGMTSEFVQSRLFKPFQTTKPEGMGIGAYESYHYVTSLGGTMTVESQPGSGTRVCLTLPQPAHSLREVA
jgi:putative PEP-CTERM system histidine kinase